MKSNDAEWEESGPSEVLEPKSLQSYKDALDLVWRQLVQLNSSLFILDKLLKFHSDLFLAPDKQTFISIVKLILFENSLLIISRLASDTSGDTLTLPRLKNEVRKQLKTKYRGLLDERLQTVKFSETTRTSLQKVRSIRNNFLAHLIVDGNLRFQITQGLQVSLSEVNSICNQLNGLFDALCFGEGHQKVPLDYSSGVQHPIGQDPRSDIEYFLDLIVQDSNLYKMPEESPGWNTYRQALSPETINTLNEYRRNFGKPEV